MRVPLGNPGVLAVAFEGQAAASEHVLQESCLPGVRQQMIGWGWGMRKSVRAGKAGRPQPWFATWGTEGGVLSRITQDDAVQMASDPAVVERVPRSLRRAARLPTL